ncbi:MAG TPA: creatininase family protein [Ktedonobacterales bacterium]
MATRRFIELSQPEIRAALARHPLVLVPLGSVEQHGPHLPTGTDYYASQVIADAVAERLDGLTLPFSPIGVTPMHMPYEGTLSVSADLFQRLLVEVVGSAAAHGAREVALINWHEGNIPALALAAETLHRAHGCSVVVVQACYVAEELFGERYGGLTHGGAIEALAVLAAHPDFVHLERVENSSDRIQGARVDHLRRTRAYQPVLRDIRAIAPTGWYGDPRGVTIEQAQAFLATVAAAIAERVAAMLAELARINTPPAEREPGADKGPADNG